LGASSAAKEEKLQFPRRHAFIVAALVLAAGAAFAQVSSSTPAKGPNMSDQDAQMDAGKEPPPTPATRAYMNAALQMHRDMAVPYTDSADKDFAATLKAHHTGAVALAEVELKYGTDPQMRQLAQQVIEARKREIALIDAWVQHHP
jgi:uncharacterized protein (DUF305 family)